MRPAILRLAHVSLPPLINASSILIVLTFLTEEFVPNTNVKEILALKLPSESAGVQTNVIQMKFAINPIALAFLLH